MTIPKSRILIINNGLALVEQPADLVHLCIGIASKGPLMTPRLVQYTALCNTFGGGIGVKSGAYSSARTEAPLIFVRVPATARPASFDVRLSQFSGNSTVVATGTPLNAALVVIEFTTPGTVTSGGGGSAAAYKVSLDGGVTFGDVTNLGTAVAIVANGVTFTFEDTKTVTGIVKVLCLPASATIYAVTVTKDGSSGTMAFSGTPIDQYEPQVEIMKGGTAGTEGIWLRYTLDGGRRWSEVLRLGTATTFELADYTTPDGSVINSGITLTLQNASTYKAGDKIVARTTAPEAQPSDITAAIDAVEAQIQYAGKCSFVHAVGHLGRRTDVTTLQAKATALVTAETFTGILTAGRDKAPGEPAAEWEAEQADESAQNAADRVFVSGGYARITDPCGQWSLRRPVAFRVAERLIARPISEALNDFSVGAVDDVDIYDTTGDVVEHDARTSSTLHDARYIVLRTRKRRPGVYFSNCFTMAGAGNDFKIIPYRRIFDIASAIFQVVGEDQLGRGIATNRTTGLIDEAAALTFDNALVEPINEAVSVNGSGVAAGAVAVQVKVSRTTPILGPNGKLQAECRIVPISFIGDFEGTIGFTRRLPAQAAA